jgi:hypothetical protein
MKEMKIIKPFIEKQLGIKSYKKTVNALFMGTKKNESDIYKIIALYQKFAASVFDEKNEQLVEQINKIA